MDRILIAEDDPLTALDLKERLESLNYEVSATTSRGREAVSLAQRLIPDLILMDIQLPGEIDGIEAAKQLRALHLPVVYVTGYYDGAILQRAKATEPYGYILKPYDTPNLKTSIEVGIHKHRAEREREHLAQRLQDALTSAKILSGLLSICAYCKKIKDDAGTWNQIEAYIMLRTSATFTHGMCPDCFENVRKQLEAFE